MTISFFLLRLHVNVLFFSPIFVLEKIHVRTAKEKVYALFPAPAPRPNFVSGLAITTRDG